MAPLRSARPERRQRDVGEVEAVHRHEHRGGAVPTQRRDEGCRERGLSCARLAGHADQHRPTGTDAGPEREHAVDEHADRGVVVARGCAALARGGAGRGDSSRSGAGRLRPGAVGGNAVGEHDVGAGGVVDVLGAGDGVEPPGVGVPPRPPRSRAGAGRAGPAGAPRPPPRDPTGARAPARRRGAARRCRAGRSCAAWQQRGSGAGGPRGPRCAPPTRGADGSWLTRVSKVASQRSASSGRSPSHSRSPVQIDPCSAPRHRASRRLSGLLIECPWVGPPTSTSETVVEVERGGGDVGDVDRHHLGDAFGDGLGDAARSCPTSTRTRPVRASSSSFRRARPAGPKPCPQRRRRARPERPGRLVV